MMKRPAKPKLDVVKPPAAIKFVETLGWGKGSVYALKLTEALNADACVLIKNDDAYMKHQLRVAAKKMKLRLVYGLSGDDLYIKPIMLDGELKRLMLWLREPRTVLELESKKLELDLQKALQQLARDGTAQVVKDKWVLTEKGQKVLV